ncbi:hypothetical protein [Cellulomonas sp. Y8]|uniref:hypothetical protein n=1 Tax=Cellulomonas sp. Y8 TaxID=2591145 RepID=UPI003D7545A3
MSSTSRSTWVGGTVVLSALVLALAWFVFISPVVDDTATAAADTQTAEDRNAVLQVQLTRLEKQFAELGTYQATLDEIEGEIPPTANTSDFLRLVDTLAVSAGTTIIDSSIGTPEPVLPAVVAAPAEEAADDAAASEDGAADGGAVSDETAAEGTADGPADAAAPVSGGAPVIPGFVAVPITVTALGNPVGVLSFLGALQDQTDRLFLVTGLDGTGQDDEEASGGRPATVKGDLELLISGYVYVLEDSAAASATEDAPAATPPATDGAGGFAKS